jgi:hypothetical protein
MHPSKILWKSRILSSSSNGLLSCFPDNCSITIPFSTHSYISTFLYPIYYQFQPPSFTSYITSRSIHSCLCFPVSIIGDTYIHHLDLSFTHNSFGT